MEHIHLTCKESSGSELSTTSAQIWDKHEI